MHAPQFTAGMQRWHKDALQQEEFEVDRAATAQEPAAFAFRGVIRWDMLPGAWKCRPKYLKVSTRSTGRPLQSHAHQTVSLCWLVSHAVALHQQTTKVAMQPVKFAAEHPEHLEHDMSWVVTPIIEDVMSPFKCYANQYTTSSKWRNVAWHKKGDKLV